MDTTGQVKFSSAKGRTRSLLVRVKSASCEKGSDTGSVATDSARTGSDSRSQRRVFKPQDMSMGVTTNFRETE